MPELPEVETIRRGLSQFIIKHKLKNTEILCEKSFIGTPTTGTVTDIRRFGKALIIDLDNQKSLMIHLRMTGQLIYDGKDRYAAGHPSENFTAKLPNKQTRVILKFDNGTLYLMISVNSVLSKSSPSPKFQTTLSSKNSPKNLGI